MVRTASAALFALLLAITAGLGSRADAGTGPLGLVRVGTFQAPVHVDNAPGFPRLLFVVEQRGTIAVLRDGQRVGRFLDIRGRVQCCGEEGLLSVAFPPGYWKSRRFYVYYTNRKGDNQVDEFKRRRDDATRASAQSRRKVLEIPHPLESNHNGGQLQFGPGSNLYVSTGDGGGGGDIHDNARRLDNLLGKLLRIDPRRDGQNAYRSPASNPYVGGPGRDEIYSYGLRNPWRFSFDRATGNIAIGDVGQNAAEEVDYETLASARGANFGWPEWEGDVPHDLARPGPDPAEPAIFTYPHSTCGACAITGGYVVRNPDLSSLAGRYVYADVYLGDIRSFIPSLAGATDDASTGLHVAYLSSFGEGLNGRIYAASLNGPVYRLRQGG